MQPDQKQGAPFSIKRMRKKSTPAPAGPSCDMTGDGGSDKPPC